MTGGAFLGDTWICHVCGNERPDQFVAVYKTRWTREGVTLQINVRYCRDREACLAGAPAVAERWAGPESVRDPHWSPA